MRVSCLLLLAALFPFSPAAQAEDWNYDNENDWAAIDQHYTACGNGKQQSPVEISLAQKKDLPPLGLHYGMGKATLERQDYTLAVNVDSSSTLTDNGALYRLTQIRFHTPSEHVVLGRFWPLEIQLMHKDLEGKILIIAIFANVGASNTAMEILLSHLDDQPLTPPDISFNPNDFIPARQGYYAYTGSLTIPPCTEGVEWRVFKQPITVSQGQLTALEKITSRNSRMPQPIYGRTIMESED